MKAREEVQQFLNRFFPKMEIWGIFFLERDKNLEALKEFGITPVEREAVIQTIVVDDYVETIKDTISQFEEMWVFGKDRDKAQLYIKLSMGVPNSQTLCISFHKAENKIHYAFK